MSHYNHDDYEQALFQINSTIHKLEKTVLTLEARDPDRLKAQITLAKRRIKAFRMAVELIEIEKNKDTPL